MEKAYTVNEAEERVKELRMRLNWLYVILDPEQQDIHNLPDPPNDIRLTLEQERERADKELTALKDSIVLALRDIPIVCIQVPE